VRPVPGLGRSAVGQACEDHGGEGVTRKKIGDVMGPGYVDEVGGGRESGGGVAPRSTPLPSKDAAANPAACMRWDSYKHDAELHERIRELEARVAELEAELDKTGKSHDPCNHRIRELESIILGINKPAFNPKIGIVVAREREEG